MALAFTDTVSPESPRAAPQRPREPKGGALARGLAQVSAAQAQGARVLFDARLDALAARIGGVQTWHAEPAAATPADFAAPGRIVLAHVAGTLAIDIDLQRYPALRIAAAAQAAQPLRQAVAAALLAPLAEALTAAGCGAWRVQSLETGAPRIDDKDCLAARVSVTFAEHRHEARLHAHPAMLALFARRLEQTAVVTPEHAPAASWRVPGRIAIGARRVAIAALEKLRPGDVLLRTMPAATERALAEGRAFDVRAAWGTAGLVRLAARAQLHESTLAITGTPTMNDEAQQADYDAAPSADFSSDMRGEPIEIGELDLPVQFELDSVALPLAQLSSLRPGYVIELDTPVTDAQIRLVAHGQTIGYGELIAVAEHLGIRIVSMAHGDGSVR
ncbi:type III secretion system cytoplasmic ring protein SctQ [Paraburkholderia acidisoli]|uniref:YscQ/HrcQ family type III secretion apparatus protein n=1 Tax=Paraburkholderia acidisoli TaxID=2571748 RepID=A0A7Z2JJX5_9BURK|nr:type III secretion system cytoplasmic ring protein SctQ [Paraburkholderia acidisoli]QGZ65825.1 YscQ/HrcQ family type III secretion apparatus protein [Paraburkholderia acidisoli]